MTQIQINDDGVSVTLRDTEKSARFHALWLLDNDAAARDANNGQRLHSFDALPSATDPALCRISDARTTPDGRVAVTLGAEESILHFDQDWLWAHAYDLHHGPQPGWVAPHIELWGREFSVPLDSFSAVKNNPTALRDWLHAVRMYGVAKLEDGPLRDGALLDIVDLFGYVRQTNYGTLFNVRSEVNPVNLAYTGLGLQAHTDNPYRDPVPSLQILYCLENSASGGESQVVDGFAVAQRLREEDPRAFTLLASHPVRFTYAGSKDVYLTSRKPIIDLTSDGELRAVHFNNRSIAPITDIAYDDMPAFYQAIKSFGALVDSSEFQVNFKLSPGESFLVDNQRVMHGRNGYDGSGTRWLQGCYPERDGLLSTLAILNTTTQNAQ